MYKKSYTGFVLGVIVYLAFMLGMAFVPGVGAQLAMRLNMLLTAWFMAILTFYIWRTERVYLYNGTSFEEAEAADSERRKTFAWKHLRVFGMFALIQTVLACAMHLLGWSAWIDFTIGAIGIVVAACITIPFKL